MASSHTTDNPADFAGQVSPATISFDELSSEIVLVKKGRRYMFRYETGEESKLLSHVVEMVQRPDNDLDWFDAAMLSHQMGRRMCRQLDQILKAG